jgi:hypothetical protein
MLMFFGGTNSQHSDKRLNEIKSEFHSHIMITLLAKKQIFVTILFKVLSDTVVMCQALSMRLRSEKRVSEFFFHESVRPITDRQCRSVGFAEKENGTIPVDKIDVL